MVNRDNTLTVQHALNALAPARVNMSMPIAVMTPDGIVQGIASFELHTYPDGSQVLMMQADPAKRFVAPGPGETAEELF